MSTIKDVAALAGVSTATVSYVLNNTRSVSRETREKVRAAARELHYVPSAAARSLRATSSRSIGLVLPDARSPLYTDILGSLSSFFQERGYSLRIAFSEELPGRECALIDEMVALNVDGLLLVSCQPENADYFRAQIEEHAIPVVFIERAPVGFSANFVGLDNYSAAHTLCTLMLDRGYRRVCLASGPSALSSEEGAIRGFTEALQAAGLVPSGEMFFSTGANKEDAFRDFLDTYAKELPQAVLCTNASIARGITTAAGFLGARLQEDLLLVCLGTEPWDNLSSGREIYFVQRPSMRLGDVAAQTLFRAITHPGSRPAVHLELADGTGDLGFDIPVAKPAVPLSAPNIHNKKTLRVLMPELESTGAIRSLSRRFSDRNGIALTYEICPQEELLEKILAGDAESYDLFAYNSPWRDLLHAKGRLRDLAELSGRASVDLSRFFPETLDNCQVGERLVGIPFTACSQLLFFRQDLFSDAELGRAFAAGSKLSLRPPRSWVEFNRVAAFFSRAHAPDAPTEFGTSFAGGSFETLGPELLIRIQAYGGALRNSYDQPTFDTEKIAAALANALETISYVPPEYGTATLEDCFDDFCSGRTAMLATFTEHAHLISRRLRKDLQVQVGAHYIPGNRPVRAGWSFGLNPASENADEAMRFLSWFCRKSTSFFLTILNGSAPFLEPYHNFELQKLYPWFPFIEASIPRSIRREVPRRKQRDVLPSDRLEGILCEAFLEAAAELPEAPAVAELTLREAAVKKALGRAQARAEQLYEQYGYPIVRHHRIK